MDNKMIFESSDSLSRGLYIHIPFCESKCRYCDFYSFNTDDKTKGDYTTALIEELDKYKGYSISTLYLGGGTPSLLGVENLEKLLSAINEKFKGIKEATLEANPADNLKEVFTIAKKGGINRISLGVQSANENELKILGRRHNNSQVIKAIEDARAVGINNISLDLMIGIPDQTQETLIKTLDFLTQLHPNHISGYMLSLEEGTPLFKNREKYNIPSPDFAAALWEKAVDYLEDKGYFQYEISNFSKKGYESKHNLKYWNGQEYIGLGAAAHGFLNGFRYSYENNAQKFIENPQPIIYDEGGSAEEYFMLKLRLKEGLDLSYFKQNFSDSKEFIDALLKFSKKYKNGGFFTLENNIFSLTKKGFLVFNSIVSEILKDI